MRFTFTWPNRSPVCEHQLWVKTPARVGGGDSGFSIVRIPYSLSLSRLFLALLCVLQAAHAASIPNNALDPVAADLAAGRADDAISRLNLSLAAKPADAEAHNLLCRVYYQESDGMMPSTSARPRSSLRRWIARITSGWAGHMAKKPTPSIP